MATETNSQRLWKDRKHVLWFPFSFLKYEVRNDRLYTQKGFFKTTFDEVLLYRITDIQLTRTFGQKLCGTGTITLCTKIDHETHIELKNIKKPKKVKELLSNAIEDCRQRNDVVAKEFLEMTGGKNGDPARHPRADRNSGHRDPHKHED